MASLSSIEAWLNHSSKRTPICSRASRMFTRIRSAAHDPAAMLSAGPSYSAARSAT
jgi:hypothetical protein